MAQDLVDTRSDPYAAHGSRAAQDGTYLSFSKGEYLYGPNKEELSIGKRLVANMTGLRAGWRRWQEGKVIEDRTELIRDGRPEERRIDLGDTDQELWEHDNDGQPRDPWVMTNILELADPESGEAYVFSTASSGGKRAIGRLCKEYAREYRMRAGMLPIIELGRDSYMHTNKAFGKIYNPVFKIVGWTDENAPSVADTGVNEYAAANIALSAGVADADMNVDMRGRPIVPTPMTTGQRAENPTQGAVTSGSATQTSRSSATPRF